MPAPTAFYQNPYFSGTAFPQSPENIKQIPTITASNAHVVNTGSGKVYYRKGDASGMTVPASIVKLMTVLLLLESKPTSAELDQTATVLASDIQTGSGNNLLEDDVIPLRSLAYNCLLPSSNTAATVVGRVIGQELLDAEGNPTGDALARFVNEMNARATALGMADTSYVETTGLNSQNASLPVDSNILIEELYTWGIAQTIFDTPSYDMPLERGGSTTTILIESTVDIITDPQVLAGKTGTLTSPSTHNLVILWEAPSGDVVAACIFGSTSDAERYSDMQAITDQLVVDYPELSIADGVAGIIANSTVTADAVVDKPIAAAVAAQSQVTAAPAADKDTSTAVTAQSTVTAQAEGAGEVTAAAAVASTSTVAAAPEADKSANAAVSAQSIATADPTAVKDATAAVAGQASVTAAAVSETANDASAGLTAQSTVASSAAADAAGTASVAATSTMTAEPAVDRGASTAVAAQSTVSVVPAYFLAAQVEAFAQSNVTANAEAGEQTDNSASVSAQSAVTSTPSKAVSVSAAVYSQSSVIAVGATEQFAEAAVIARSFVAATPEGGTTVYVGYLTAREVTIIPAMSCYTTSVKPQLGGTVSVKPV